MYGVWFGLICILTILKVISADNSTIPLDECLKKDSILCLQVEVYKLLKKSLNEPFKLAGLSLSVSDRGAKSLDEIETEHRIISTNGVLQKQSALEDYIISCMKRLWNRGSVTWNPRETLKTFVEYFPSKSTPIEGRGDNVKKGEQSKFLVPLLIAIMLKLSSFAALFFLGIAFIAKKAAMAGVISLLVSGFIAVKNLIEGYQHGDNLFPSPYQASWHSNFYHPYHLGSTYEQDLSGNSVKQNMEAIERQ